MIDTERLVYLDYHATTPCDPRVVEAMLPFLTTLFANPSSQTHRAGRAAAQAVASAREHVASLIGADPGEIVFTGSATESNNLAVLGLSEAAPRERRQILTTAIEHKSVLEPVAWLGQRGFEVRLLRVDRLGRLDFDDYRTELDNRTFLVSVQAANNEIGTVQSVREIAALAHERGAFVHCDAVQAVGRIPVDVLAWDVDLLSLNAHKLYGPKGIAALYVRGGRRALPIRPIMLGGGQEDGLRPGTLNVPAIVGFGKAAELCCNELMTEADRISRLRDYLEVGLLSAFPWAWVNGDRAERLPGNSSVTFPRIDAEALIANVTMIALSAGSACNSGALEPSHVLTAVGLSHEEAYQTVRVGLGRFTEEGDVEAALKAIGQAVERLSEEPPPPS